MCRWAFIFDHMHEFDGAHTCLFGSRTIFSLRYYYYYVPFAKWTKVDKSQTRTPMEICFVEPFAEKDYWKSVKCTRISRVPHVEGETKHLREVFFFCKSEFGERQTILQINSSRDYTRVYLTRYVRLVSPMI